eukprot:CAMPEP_0197424828 /NCGR_PEP_ID=MMETSP1170-20131217/28114_1 /TAXON_ID=54406 /ORGANISM="Sarcinochrysis sp, Strain CCMP770" /LENGTH=60 /DNA_ID=CAMNT_0042952333 /DNA_START=29 /DNA_END=211 /DNA_ORIENTATION=+
MALAAKLIDKARGNDHAFLTPDARRAALFDNCPTSTALYPAYVQAYFLNQSWLGLAPACP